MNEYLIANYHAHTPRCKHAFDTERDYVEAAIKAGIKKFGFSDHVPCPYKNGYVSRIRMGMEEAKDYVADIRRLQKEYEGQIQLYVGFETEYIPEFYEEQMELFRQLGCDYMIIGQHFLTTEEIGPYSGAPSEDETFLIAYVDRVIEAFKTGNFLYLAHPDLVNYRGSDNVYEREITRLCTSLKEMSIPLEINLLGLAEEKHYPREQFWKIAGQVGNDVILGIDAHWAKQIGDMECYKKAMHLVEKYNLNLLHELPL